MIVKSTARRARATPSATGCDDLDDAVFTLSIGGTEILWAKALGRHNWMSALGKGWKKSFLLYYINVAVVP